MSSDENGEIYPEALAFSPGANAFYSLEASPQGKPRSATTGFTKIDWLAGEVGSVRVVAYVSDPANLTFDGKAQRLLILQVASNSLVEVPEGANGELQPQKVKRTDISRFGLQNPQGLSVDPASGRLFILDATGPRLVRVDPAAGGALDKGAISSVKLSAPGLSSMRGLAFDPNSGHLHVLAGKHLYEFTQAGALVASRDLAEFALGEPQGMVFAPSGDLTDDPQEMSLFLADGNQIVEFTFTPLVAPATINYTSTVVQTTDMSAISPPSPDSSGVTYLPASNRLVMVDGEVEEVVQGITHFQGANVWELTLGGAVLRTTNISTVAPTYVPMTDEPTGITWNSLNNHYYVTDDVQKVVFDLDPGGDGLIGTDDDTWTQFSTQAIGNGDPEGITINSANNRLFVADGVNREVYEYTLDGSPVSHFDVLVFGVEDPESVEFNPVSGTLFVMSSKQNNQNDRIIVETTTGGALIQTISISAANAKQAAGLAYAPASNGSGLKRFYIVDRGVDNNSNPTVIDGKMYEMTAPPKNDPPVAVDDNATTVEDTAVNIDVAANDSDPDNNLNPASANTDCTTCSLPTNGNLVNNNNGTFTYTPNAQFIGSDGFTYEICDSLLWCDTANVSITVNPDNLPPVAGDDSANTNEDTSVMVDVAQNDTDPDGNLDPSSANTTCGSCSAPANGNLINNLDGTFTYSPDVNFFGADGFTYEICDSGIPSLCDTATVSITVNPVNDPPITKDDNATTNEDFSVTINVAANDSDPEGALDLASLNTDCPACSVPANGTLVKTADNKFTLTPNPDFNGSDNFVYQICDDLGACSTGKATVKFNPVADPPLANDDNANTLEDNPVTIKVSINDSDPDGDLDKKSANIDCSACTLPSHGSLLNNRDGSFTYNPDPNYRGQDSFIYEICDKTALCDTALVLIKVKLVRFYFFLPVASNAPSSMR